MDKNVSQSGAGGDILGADNTSVQSRKGKTITRTENRFYRHRTTFRAHTGYFPAEGGHIDWNWDVIPFANSLQKAWMPVQWVAAMQDANRFHIDSFHVRLFGFSSYVTLTKQDTSSAQTNYNAYMYFVTDDDYLLPGYNVNESYYDTGSIKSGIGEIGLKAF